MMGQRYLWWSSVSIRIIHDPSPLLYIIYISHSSTLFLLAIVTAFEPYAFVLGVAAHFVFVYVLSLFETITWLDEYFWHRGIRWPIVMLSIFVCTTPTNFVHLFKVLTLYILDCTDLQGYFEFVDDENKRRLC